MRLHYLLLTVIAALLVCCGGVLASTSSPDARQRKLKMEIPDLVSSGGTNNRFLRNHETYNGSNGDESEERAGQGLLNKFLGRNDLTMKKLSRMMNDDEFKLKMFQNWDKHQQSLGKIREKMFLELNPRYEKLLLEYLNEYQRTGQKLKKFKPRKRPTGNRVRFGEVKYADDLDNFHI
ncbi:Secreted RxLR effector peptide protein [Phytophthora palmivora]|uniref:RxLR effector protein n=1 Tax=Phytophthora palmivora TaxID=4796 RepID=A0A2P4WX61_9STRA|nr:Secreted RxLR effector peptide protein [Phytophthora palmivora]